MSFLSALLRWAFGIIITTLVILFAVANSQPVSLTWNPLSLPATVPVFLPVLAGMAIGFLAGGFMVWLGNAEIRADRRRQSRALRDLEQKIEKSGGESLS